MNKGIKILDSQYNIRVVKIVKNVGSSSTKKSRLAEGSTTSHDSTSSIMTHISWSWRI